MEDCGTSTSSELEDDENKNSESDCPEIKPEIKTEEEELRGKTGGFHCGECSAHFFYEEYFLEHIRELHLPSKRVKPAAAADSNNDGNNKLSNERLSKCTDCSYAARNKSDLTKHELIHTNERPHKCSECSFATREKSSLRRHQLIHSNERPHNSPVISCQFFSIQGTTEWQRFECSKVFIRVPIVTVQLSPSIPSKENAQEQI